MKRLSTKKSLYKVIECYQPDSNLFVSIKRNEQVIYVKEYNEKPEWSNWVECLFNGKTCYVPKQYLYNENERYYLDRDYNSKELSVEIGMIVTVDFFLNGFAYGNIYDLEEKGWIPQSILKMI